MSKLALKFVEIQLTQHEIQQAMKHSIHKSKKSFKRKDKHNKRQMEKFFSDEY